ncbi:MAG: hypothetical protein FD126_3030 [Elusimicrobia bacterium]|nr:MAG: hypothetical protein FD126_3030 [Elusimicrobiota bacterium]
MALERRQQALAQEGLEPLRVVTDLDAVLAQDLEGLVLVGGGVSLDVGLGQRGARRVAAGRVADAGGEIPDDEDGGVPQVLEMPELLEDDGVAEVQVRRGRVHAELHAQGAPLRELLLKLRRAH